jgi:hypothetical protein
MTSDTLASAASGLVVASGLGTEFELEPLAGGANNRVYRVTAPSGCALLKAYFSHPADLRDRLGAEWAFSSYAWNHGVRALPRPLSHDRALSLGLYEFIEGRKLKPGEVDVSTVNQAIAFFMDLNSFRHFPTARVLPTGSEAGFSLVEHFRCIERRVQRLETIEESSDIHREAVRFIHDELLRIWAGYEEYFVRATAQLKLNPDVEISRRDRCVSPSDFGFHNALQAVDGRLRFIDFEYAGWDDPVRMICDFFCQPAVPIPMEFLEGFADAVLSDLTDPAFHRRRLAVMLPLYQIKWCCIILNHFLPVGNQRRRFAMSSADLEEQKSFQLEKARNNIRRITLKHAA